MEDWSYQLGLPSINKEFAYLLTILFLVFNLMIHAHSVIVWH